LQELVSVNKLKEKVELSGTFCLGRCQEGVCVKVGDKFFSVSPGTTKDFFNKEILGA
jgi:NADH:ubiquinone oxidoreductase subunit E